MKKRIIPDAQAMQDAVRAFIAAMGLDVASTHLKQTPARVAEAWTKEFIDGYAQTPEEILQNRFRPEVRGGRDLVVVSQVRFHSVCPHHLLPYQGLAHLAYVPSEWMVGFGRMPALLNCFAHRLILQEELCKKVAQALSTCLESPATACVIQAEHACLRLRNTHQRGAITHTEAYQGWLKTNRGLRHEFWARIGANHEDTV